MDPRFFRLLEFTSAVIAMSRHTDKTPVSIRLIVKIFIRVSVKGKLILNSILDFFLILIVVTFQDIAVLVSLTLQAVKVIVFKIYGHVICIGNGSYSY